ncbi:deoxyribose-phosphate aldolase [Salibacterium halotolerans]|uniref:Deoxyribose-phosphate aldolase n=1 Tax=Salibacterium halotolerans TaxID=1884432 RepID=A0A1I5R2Q8_9BACI|nr:deoxyribose-phosphate aldolase [Salibacterium halotolerans]SFP52792.1 deoxyribose-phosphate aldolase [Salibacterium halotolerans]
MQTNLAEKIDHTQLKPDTSNKQIQMLCAEAREYEFYSVCVLPVHVTEAYHLLQGSGVKVCTVIGFPLGASTTETKMFETKDTLEKGAEEIDMVLPIGLLKDGEETAVENDIRAVVTEAKGKALVKVILETALLTDEEKRTACRLAVNAGADFVKTSTGFVGGGAKTEDITLMRETVGNGIGVKASGGIRDRETADAMVAAGADRVGASVSVSIVKE